MIPPPAPDCLQQARMPMMDIVYSCRSISAAFVTAAALAETGSRRVAQVVVVANLKPATLRGVESQGMVLAASDGGSTVLIAPERPIRVGSTVK